MTQLLGYAEKLDEPLARLIEEAAFAPDSPIGVIVTVASERADEVATRIVELGGRVRHRIGRLGMVAAWVPLSQIATLTALGSVSAIEMEQRFSIA